VGRSTHVAGGAKDPTVSVTRHYPPGRVFEAQFDLVDRLVTGTLPFLAHPPGIIDVAVGRPVELGKLGFERMRAELLDINRDRHCQPLRV
jgi:hypothetical protein